MDNCDLLETHSLDPGDNSDHQYSASHDGDGDPLLAHSGEEGGQEEPDRHYQHLHLIYYLMI